MRSASGAAERPPAAAHLAAVGRRRAAPGTCPAPSDRPEKPPRAGAFVPAAISMNPSVAPADRPRIAAIRKLDLIGQAMAVLIRDVEQGASSCKP